MLTGYTSVKVFTATKANERQSLGEVMTAWLETANVVVIDTVVRQSSDNQFHCLSVLVFYRDR